MRQQSRPAQLDDAADEFDFSHPEFRAAQTAIYEQKEPCILIHGGAGVGKTSLVRSLRDVENNDSAARHQVFVSPTAISAIQVGGQTIHSFFQLPPRLLDANHLDPPRGSRPVKLWRHMKRLVIDEISMVRADIIDAIDARLREYRDDSRPFGGVQIVMVGDPLQLPPVIREHGHEFSDEPELLRRLGYPSHHFFAAHSLQNLPLTPFHLTKIFRQKEGDFINALQRIRSGRRVPEAIRFLNQRCHRPSNHPERAVILTPTRKAADHYNEVGLASLPGEIVEYHGVIEGKFSYRDNLPVPEILRLKPGAKVIAVQNDPARRWANGSHGTVSALHEDHVEVEFHATGAVYPVGQAHWEQNRQSWNDTAKRVDSEIIGRYLQIPLIHGWAMTIHKSQGTTLDDVEIDLGARTFAAGQLYVALSRATSLNGLALTRELSPDDVKTDLDILKFLTWAEQQVQATPLIL